MLKKVWTALFLMCLLFLVNGCSNNEKEESGKQDQTEVADKQETEEPADDTTGSKKIIEGKLYDAVDEVAAINYIREMEVEGDPVLYISIKEDTPETFIKAAEKIAGLDEIRAYPNLNLSAIGLGEEKETAMLSIIWNKGQARYESTCFDLTADKRVEKVYQQNAFFSKIDMMNNFNEKLDDLKDEFSKGK